MNDSSLIPHDGTPGSDATKLSADYFLKHFNSFRSLHTTPSHSRFEKGLDYSLRGGSMGSIAYGATAQKSLPRFAKIGFWLGLIALVFLMIAGPGYRLHLWTLAVGLQILIPAALFVGIAGVIFSLVGFIRPEGRVLALLGFIMSVIAAGIPVYETNLAKNSPIHDVSTDTTNPPQFSAVVSMRVAGVGEKINPTTYDAQTAELQRKTYSDIGPLHLDVPPAQAFERALAAANNLGWDVVASDPPQTCFEATATTFWFGFKNDIAVRIIPEGSGSRVDVRSLSRIGQSDVGMNARTVRSYLHKLKS
jgi:uncharacterized protein (DUF1499 family)